MPYYPALTEIGMTIVRVIVYVALGLGCAWGLAKVFGWALKQ